MCEHLTIFSPGNWLGYGYIITLLLNPSVDIQGLLNWVTLGISGGFEYFQYNHEVFL